MKQQIVFPDRPVILMVNSEIVFALVIPVESVPIVNGILELIWQWHQQQVREQAGTLLIIALSRSRTRSFVFA